MRRRDFIRCLGGAMIAAPRAAAAQKSPKVYRLATFNPGPPLPDNSLQVAALVRGLAQRGYKLGQNLMLEARGATGQQVAKMPELARLGREMAADKIDAVAVAGYPAALAMKGTGVPAVVFVGVGDPVATGLVDGLARPGGNITGISDVATTLSTKRLGLLKSAAPGIRRVAMLWNRDDLAMTQRKDASAKAATALGITVQPLGVGEPDDFDGAFAAMDREPPDAILMVSDTLTVLNRKRVFEYAVAKRLPAIYENEPYVREGGLMSYGADVTESCDRAADMIARILQGAKPADLPFEQPTRYPFVINLKTAKSIGFEFPPMVLALADEVIE
jgi:putative tryptophan/tyrosine transport system substrate-binding protein